MRGVTTSTSESLESGRTPRAGRKFYALALAAAAGLGLSKPVMAVNGFWDGSAGDNSWGTLANWSTTAAGGTDVASVPTGSETANFNITALTSAQTVNLNGNRSVAFLTVASTATGGLTLLGGSGDASLTLSNSFSIGSTAGAVTIGSTTAGQAVNIVQSGTLNINNQSTNLLTFVNNVSLSGTTNLNNSGSGGALFTGNITGVGLTINTTGGTATFTGTLSNSALSLSRGNVVIGGTGGFLNANATVGNNGILNIDDRDAVGDRVGNTRNLTLNNGSTFRYFGNESADSAESLGNLVLTSGQSTYTVTYGGTNQASVTHASLSRAALTGGIGLINGVGLGSTGASSSHVFFTTAPSGVAFVGTTNGTGAVNPGVYDTKIVPYLLGESSGGVGTATGTANTFLTYDATAGLRPLDLATEFANNTIGAGNNTYISAATNAAATTAINSLIVGNTTLTIAPGETLTNTSGATRFNGNGQINGGTLAYGSVEGLISLGAGTTSSIGSTITGTNSLTFSGPGSVALNSANTYSGTTVVVGGATVLIGDVAAFGTSTVTGTGVIQADGQARTIGNKLLANGTIGSAPQIGGWNDVTLSGAVNGTAMSVAQFHNANFVISNTGNTNITGVIALTDNASGSQNGGPFLTLASGANVIVSGAIQDNTAGNVAAAASTTQLVFTGTGANLTINPTSANNNFGATRGFTVNVTNPGYNTITIGGPGGTGATITPFGAGTLQPNNTSPFYLQAATNGQILNNGYASGGSAVGFGFAGANSLTMGATYVTQSTHTFSNIASGTFTFANTLTLGGNFTVNGSGNTVFASTSSLGGGARTLSIINSGTTTLAGANSLTGNQVFVGGTIILDYTAGDANRLNQAATTSAAAMTVAGVNLQLKGGAYTQGLGGSNGTTIALGASNITRDGGSSTIALGALTRASNNGGVIDFQSGVASTTSAGTNGILGGYATVGKADWAVGGGAITAYSGYAAFAGAGSTANASLTGSGAVAATQAVYSLKIDNTAPGESLAIAGGQFLTVVTGGVLFVGDNDYAISGGTIRSTATTSTDMVFHTHGDGVLTINSVIANGTGNNALTKTGTGTLVLGATSNTYNGGVNLLGGVLSVSSSSNLNAGGTINFNGGTLRTTGSFDTASRGITFYANGGTFDVADGTTLTTTSGIASNNSYGGFTKTGAGTLLMNGASTTYSGPTNINAGVLKLGNATALGSTSAGTSPSNRSNAPTFINGGTLDIAGVAANLGNITMTSGAITDTVGGGSLSGYSFTLQSGTVGASLGNVVITGNVNSNSSNVYKTTAGTVTLTGANTYTGTTNVSGGTLLINNTTGSGTGGGNVVVRSGGTFGGTGAISGSIEVQSGGVLAPGAGNIESLNAGGLAMTGSSVFRVEVNTDSNTADQLILASDAAAELSSGTALLDLVLTGSIDGAYSQSFTLINNTGVGALEGYFAGLAPTGGIASFVGPNASYTLNYTGGTGNDLVLTFSNVSVPEPASLGLLALGATGLLGRRRRRVPQR